MSKKNHNYTNYSKPQTAPVEPEVTEEVVEPVVTEEPEVVQEEEIVTPEPPVEPAYGVVTECVKLNVRKEPNANADVVTTLLLGTDVMIDEVNSTEDFYKIVTGAGVEGFCMKKFINTNL